MATLSVVSIKAGPKIRVATYKAKSRFRKVKGHRQQQSILKVVSLGKSSPQKTASKPAATKAAKKPPSKPKSTQKTSKK